MTIDGGAVWAVDPDKDLDGRAVPSRWSILPSLVRVRASPADSVFVNPEQAGPLVVEADTAAQTLGGPTA